MKIGIVLGGGGPKCLAHVGMFKVFEEHGIEFDNIVSSSSGSLIAALIANRIKPDKILKEFRNPKVKRNWRRISLSKSSILSQPAMRIMMQNLLSNRKIEKSPVKLTMIGTELKTGTLHLFEKGDIIDAAMASASWPGLFFPLISDGKIIADGGIMNNLPADICKKKVGNGMVITSSLDLDFERFKLKNPIETLFRCAYIPLINQRKEIMARYSDVTLEYFKHLEFNIKNYVNTNMFSNPKKLEEYYEMGYKVTDRNISMIKQKIRRFDKKIDKGEHYGKTKSIDP